MITAEIKPGDTPNEKIICGDLTFATASELLSRGNILIANNNISQISSTNISQPNWGIGIGVAGAGYSDSFPDGTVAQDFVIEGNTISGARQGIHVEGSQTFHNPKQFAQRYKPILFG